MKIAVRFLLLLGLLPLVSTTALAKTLFLLDSGHEMRAACAGQASATPLAGVTDYLQSVLREAVPGKDYRVFDFSGRELTREDGFSVPPAAAEARDIDLSALLSGTGRAAASSFDRVVVIGHSQAHQGALLELVSRDARRVPRFEVYLFSADSRQSLDRAVSAATEGLAFSRFGCAATDGWQAYVDRVARDVRVRLAESLGVRTGDIVPDTDIYRDLGSDTLKVYEAVADICDAFGVPVAAADVSTVTALTDYLTEAQLDAGRVTGDGEDILFRDMPRAEEVYIQKVFYATNRAAGTDGRLHFTGARAQDPEPVSYGTVDVAIPKNHRQGKMGTPFLSLEIFSDPKAHFQIARVTRTDKDTFFETIRARLGAEDSGDDWRDDLVVFVHGFNVSFDEAAKRTAQIAYDFGFTGVPVMFSWPSDAKLYSYLSDREDVQWSVAHIERFLSDIISRAPAKRIHLIAHSMGSQGLIGALHRLALKRGSGVDALFRNVILAAPDFDAQLFAGQIAPEVVALSDNWTIYTSDNDSALKISTTINSAYRLGLPVTPVTGVSVIDATGIEVTPWSVPEFHSYYATKQQVIEDMVKVIRGETPGQRKLQRKIQQGRPYWRFGISG